jgi:CheY-like chemotaxis protein
MEGDTANLRIVIRDTGIGIPEDRQTVLFQSFSQVDSSITRKYGGSGLGLIITKNLLALAGGAMTLESALGQGTKVTVNLPLDIDVKAAGEAAAHAAKYSLNGLRVVLVDPCEMQRSLVLPMLTDMGCEALAFGDIEHGFEAIAAADSDSETPRLLLMPLEMATENNGENLRRLREGMGLRNIPEVLALAPFGYDEATLGKSLGAAAPRPSALIGRPVVSFNLQAAMRSLVYGPDDLSEAAEDNGGDGIKVPWFPDSRILLVEDNIINQLIAGEILQDAGITVTMADNGRIAVEMLENAPDNAFDLVFMDLQMPEMDGFTATELIRAMPRFAALPIIAMTAHATVDERKHCLDVGMNEHIAKPIDVAALYDTLRRWLKPARKKIDTESVANPIDDSPLPDLPGIDAADGLARHKSLRGYKAALLAFYLQHAYSEEELLSCLKAGDKDGALLITASIRRHAESIGARNLALAAGKAFNQLHDYTGANLAGLPGYVGEDGGPGPVSAFLTEFRAAIGLLGFLFPEPLSSDLNSGGLTESGKKALRSDIATLKKLLTNNDPDARVLFDQIRPLLNLTDGLAAVETFKALALHDFSAALAALRPLEEHLRR